MVIWGDINPTVIRLSYKPIRLCIYSTLETLCCKPNSFNQPNSKNTINTVIKHNTADGYYISISQNITS